MANHFKPSTWSTSTTTAGTILKGAKVGRHAESMNITTQSPNMLSGVGGFGNLGTTAARNNMGNLNTSIFGVGKNSKQHHTSTTSGGEGEHQTGLIANIGK